jgi:hypothetical protein
VNREVTMCCVIRTVPCSLCATTGHDYAIGVKLVDRRFLLCQVCTGIVVPAHHENRGAALDDVETTFKDLAAGAASLNCGSHCVACFKVFRGVPVKDRASSRACWWQMSSAGTLRRNAATSTGCAPRRQQPSRGGGHGAARAHDSVRGRSFVQRGRLRWTDRIRIHNQAGSQAAAQYGTRCHDTACGVQGGAGQVHL